MRLAAVITVVGAIGIFKVVALPLSTALAVAIIEVVAGIAITARALRRS